jgi:hypothetical protein
MRKLCLLVCYLAACSDDGVRHTPDAAPHDGPAIDGTPDAPVDSAPLAVTLTTSTSGGPNSGVRVYFQDADGTVVLATTTDANGTASAVMAAGGYVTAINPYGANAETGDELDTFAGVKPGDHLVLNGGFSFATGITVNVVADADPAATALYAYSACGSGQLQQAAIALAPPSGQVTLFNCGTTTDFLIISTDQNGVPLNYFSVPNVAVADQATIDLTGNAYAGVPARTYTYTNPGTLSISFQDSLLSAQGRVYTNYSSVDSTGTTTYPMPTIAGTEDLVLTSVYPGGSNQQTWLDWGPYSATFTTDAAARTLPSFGAGTPNFDPATHTMTFTEMPGAVTPDFVYAAPQNTRQIDNKHWTWRIAAAHTTSIVFPVIPTDVYDYNFNVNDTPYTADIGFGRVAGGWDAVRPYVLASGLSPDAFVTGATGSAELNRYALSVRRPGDTMARHAQAVSPAVLPHRVR